MDKKGRGLAKRVEEQGLILVTFGQFLMVVPKKSVNFGVHFCWSFLKAWVAQKDQKALKGRGGWSTFSSPPLPLCFIGEMTKG